MIEKFWRVSATSPSGLVWTQYKRYCAHSPGDPPCNTPDAKGYLTGGFGGKNYKAHRVVFYLTHGYWPTLVDHIDGDRSNNRPDNLRDASLEVNAQNRLAGGCSFDKYSGKWKAYISFEGKQITLGRFPSKAWARQAYLNAKREYHPTAPERCYA